MRSPEKETVSTEELVLEWLTCASQEIMSGQMLRHVEPRVWLDPLTEDLTAQLFTYVLAEKILTEDRKEWFEGHATLEKSLTFREALRLVFHRNRTVTQVTDVQGYVDIHVAHYETFPESRIDYPKNLGRAVPLTKLHAGRSHLHQGDA
jgi:hypothetical protein